MQLLALLILYQSLFATALPVDDEVWQSWKQTHGKVYNDNSDENARRCQFESNLDVIAKHNAKYELGLSSYALGLNKFADLSSSEFKKLYLSGGILHAPRIHRGTGVSRHVDDTNAPKSLDWRDKGLVTPIKDQQLVDCSKDYGNNGCNGGLMTYAFNYLSDFGLETENDYPYTAEVGKCAYRAKKAVTGVTSYMNISAGDEKDLKLKMAKYGPVSVGIDANDDFQLYTKGVFISDTCSETDLDHGVLAVGYGRLGKQDYWIVKNSWGTGWGQEGYILLARNRNNMCGIATAASIPFV